MNKYLQLLARLEIKEASPNEAVNWALQKISENRITDSVNDLAWLSDPSRLEAVQLLRKAIVELGVSLPDERELKLMMAKLIAKSIIEGRTDPNVGCTMIGEINHELDWPKELGVLGLLAHEQTGHENLGITAQNIRLAILEEAERLASAT